MRRAFIQAIHPVLSTLPLSPATSWAPPFPGEPARSRTDSLLLQRLSSLTRSSMYSCHNSHHNFNISQRQWKNSNGRLPLECCKRIRTRRRTRTFHPSLPIKGLIFHIHSAVITPVVICNSTTYMPFSNISKKSTSWSWILPRLNLKHIYKSLLTQPSTTTRNHSSTIQMTWN